MEGIMNTKKFYGLGLVTIFLLVFSTTGFSKDNAVTSKWTVQPPIIDGLSDDWTGDVFGSEEKLDVHYAVRNDAQNMYVLLVFKDKKSLSSISGTGITLYYDIQGKKKKDYAHNYIKKQVTADELIAYLGQQGQVLTEEKIQSIKAKDAYVVYMAQKAGKKNKNDTTAAPGSDAILPAFKINTQDGAVIYEFKIPLLKSEISPEGIGIDPGQNLKLGFEWGGMSDEMRKQRDRAAAASSGDVSREGLGRGAVDTNSVGRAMPGASGGGAAPKKHSFWIDVKLAQEL